MTLRLIVPSIGRPELLARQFPFVEHADVVIEASQEGEYQAAFKRHNRTPRAMVPVDTGGVSGAELYNICLDAVWTANRIDACFFLHDTTQCISTLVAHGEQRLSTDDAIDAIKRTCASAVEAKCGVCGFGGLKPTEFRVFAPISVVADIDWESMGICNRSLRFDVNAGAWADTEMCLRGVLRNGMVFRDNRYRVHRSADPRAVAGTAVTDGAAYLNERYRRYGGGRVAEAKPKARGVDGWTKRVRFDQIRAEGP